MRSILLKFGTSNWLKTAPVPNSLLKFLAQTSSPILRNYNLLYPQKAAGSSVSEILPEKQPTRALRIKFPFVSPVPYFYFNKNTNLIFLAIFIDNFLKQLRNYFNKIHAAINETDSTAINPLKAAVTPNFKFIFYFFIVTKYKIVLVLLLLFIH